MIISGTITQVGQPSEPSGQFQVRYQDIIITDQNGQEWPGRIGSKQGYQANTPISVTVENKEDGEGGHYSYFRKYNPQYPDQATPQETVGGYRKLPRGQQAPQQAAERPNAKKEVDWDAIAEGKVRHGVLCAMLQGGLEVDYKAILEFTRFVVTGQVPQEGSEPEQTETEWQAQGQQSVSEQADDIPF